MMRQRNQITESFYRLTPAAILVMLVACSQESVPVMEQAATPPAPPAEPRPTGLIAADAEWEQVSQGYVYTDSPVAGEGAEVFFAAPIRSMLYRVDAAGELHVFDKATAMTMGLTRGADGRMYGCRNQDAQIVVYDADGSYQSLYQGVITPLPNNPAAPGEFCNDIAVSKNGNLWFTDRVNRKVMLLNTQGEVSVVAGGFRGNGIGLSLDEQTIVVTDSIEPRLWAFAVAEDGSLTERADFFGPLHTVRQLANKEIVAEGRPGTNGVTVDSQGRFYVASFYGIQVYEPEGNYIGVIDGPQGFVSNLVFAGINRDVLYTSGATGVWRIPMLVRGVER
jgi:sugar lactone lactonase YvrE